MKSGNFFFFTADETDCEIPECARSGKFAAKQCCDTSGKCHCVNPDTGAKTTEPTTDSNLSCPSG